uniref:peptide-methionine (S)-S-oxide reductase n=1 Tax=Steinernema glaseri TaxID=37863 RepID=A0A1I8AV57_9BILA
MTLQKAYLGMQCFWGAESSFAKVSGVLKTRVGYAGGSSAAPTYKSIGDHTEITEVLFDESVVSYAAILDWFFSHHDPTVHRKKQYQSGILYVDEVQKKIAEEALGAARKKFTGELETYIQPFSQFYVAEDYHQKYWLRSQKDVHEQLQLSDQELIDSPLAAKVNAFLAGYADFNVLKNLQKEYNLNEELVAEIEGIAKRGGDPRACH